MNKSSTEKTFTIFHDWIDDYISLINKSIDNKSPFQTKKEKAEVLEAFLLKICAQWEVLINDLLIDCLNKDNSKYASYYALSLPKHLSRDVCTAMVNGLGYFDFKGVGDIKSKSKRILSEANNPFIAINNDAAAKIDELFVMRNYLSHYSTISGISLRKIYERHKRRRFCEPGYFLISVDGTKGKPRMQKYIDAIINAAETMENKLAPKDGKKSKTKQA